MLDLLISKRTLAMLVSIGILSACGGRNLSPSLSANALSTQALPFRSTAEAFALPHFKAFPVPTAPDHLTEGSDGNIWFVTSSRLIGRITAAGVVTTLPRNGPEVFDNSEIISGPDGNLWFSANFPGNFAVDYLCEVDPATSTLGRCNKTGTLVFARGITTAPGNSVWFQFAKDTANGFEYGIGAIAANGTAQTCLDSILQGGDLVTGPDNRVWTTGTGVIARFTMPQTCPPHGTLYQVKDVNGGPIIVGPDKSVWFAAGSAIGRITTQGVVTNVFPITGLNGHSVSSLATGADGNVWFTSQPNDLIGRMTKNGTVTLFRISGQPQYIAAGSNGSLWFTEYTGNKIATFTP